MGKNYLPSRKEVRKNLKKSDIFTDKEYLNKERVALNQQLPELDARIAHVDGLLKNMPTDGSTTLAEQKTYELYVKEFRKLNNTRNKIQAKTDNIDKTIEKKDKQLHDIDYRSIHSNHTALKIVAGIATAAVGVTALYYAFTQPIEATVQLGISQNTEQQPQTEQPPQQEQQPNEQKVLSAGDIINFTNGEFFQTAEGGDSIIASGLHVVTGKFAYVNAEGQVIGVVKANNINEADVFAEEAGIDTNYAYALFATQENYPKYQEATNAVPFGIMPLGDYTGAENTRGFVDVVDIPVAE